MDHVIRFVPTYLDEHGTRILMRAAAGPDTFATREEAQAWLDAALTELDPDRIRARWGRSPRFDVRPCRCAPVDFTPLEAYFECF